VESNPTDPWADDQLGRREEAQLLQDFLERSVQLRIRGDWASAYTIAIDGSYGLGKTYFLKGLAAQLASTRQVAFVDAWSDDFQDDPLAAIAATLQTAFQSLLQQDEAAAGAWSKFVETSGNLANIVGRGLLRRGLGFVITQSAAEGVETLLNLGDMTSGELSKAITNSPEKVLEGGSATHRFTFQDRLNEFNTARSLINQMTASLEEVIVRGEQIGQSSPVYIIIDEIDHADLITQSNYLSRLNTCLTSVDLSSFLERTKPLSLTP